MVGKAGKALKARRDRLWGGSEPCSHAKFQNPANAECVFSCKENSSRLTVHTEK